MRATPLCLALLELSLALPGSAQLPVEIHEDPRALLASTDPVLAANKQLVFDYHRVVVEARHVEHLAEYVAPDYVEYSPGQPSGRDALAGLIAKAAPQPIRDRPADLVSIVAEGDLVVLAFRRELFDLEHEGETYTTTWFDLYRVVAGKIAAHWDFGPRD